MFLTEHFTDKATDFSCFLCVLAQQYRPLFVADAYSHPPKEFMEINIHEITTRANCKHLKRRRFR